MLSWIAGGVAVLAVLAFLGAQVNKRTCMRAYLQGVDDTGTLTWANIGQRYRSYLNPMRPMDAAAYQRGVEYGLNSLASDAQAMEADFLDAFKSGAITREGTSIRQLGPELAASSFRPRIGENLEAMISRHPEVPPLVAKLELENAKKSEALPV